MNNKRLIDVCTKVLALGVLGAAGLAQAAGGDGSINGRLNAPDKALVGGAEITARDPATGFSRTVTADGGGSYRFNSLPAGTYTLEATKDGKSLGTLEDVTVKFGNATKADLDLSGQSLEEITVVARRVQSAVDVTSTEIATNVSREELDRLPVDRSLEYVAQLAPGVVKGEGFGSGTGLSFGGSSVAENTIYINGLNVTDFYNRIGFSAVPYSFYKEFQVKTGGYSVEFGRTTGGVVNALTRSGTNEFEFGGEVAWEPSSLQAHKTDRPGILGHYDEYDRTNYNAYASGAIIQDKLFFFALYEFRNYQPVNTDNAGIRWNEGKADDDFWGAKIDWHINDSNKIELFGFSDK